MKLPDQETIDGYRNGCLNSKKPEDCHMFAEFLRTQEHDLHKAITIHKVNCDEYKYSKSCLEYGNYAFSGIKEKNIASDPAEALKYFEKGCNFGGSDNCLNSGLLLVSPKLENSPIPRNIPKGIDYLNKSCELNNGNACFYLSGMYMSGANSKLPLNNNTTNSESKSNDTKSSDTFILEKDPKKAFMFTCKACDLKNWLACANLSLMYASGTGTEKNREKSEHYKNEFQKLREEQKRKEVLSRFRHP